MKNLKKLFAIRYSLFAASNGQAMIVVLVLMLFLFPIAAAFLYVSVTEMTHTRMERRFKTATALANNVLVDLMRQFSQSFYEGHYDAESLARNEMFYEVGFSTVTITADPIRHYLYIQATGKYGKDANNPLSDKNLYAVVQFVSDLTDYGTSVNSNFTTSASNVTYTGKMRIGGTWTISGSNIKVMGGPVFTGSISGGSGCTIYGDLYYQTSKGAVTVTGNTYNYLPEMQWPTISSTYYSQHYNYKFTSDKTIVFNSDQTFTVVGSTVVYSIPSSGCIIYGQNCNFDIRGTVHGRVTMCATYTTSGKGKIRVYQGNLVYANGTYSASVDDSFAALATGGITFYRTGSDMYVSGVFFDGSSSNMQATGSSGKKLYIYGTRNKNISLSGFSGGVSISYDPNLNLYPPPGLPEKPYLVTWHMK
ncbi:MAG: hypothetical protein WC947_07545 [Elusimicrobiota bacterium]